MYQTEGAMLLFGGLQSKSHFEQKEIQHTFGINNVLLGSWCLNSLTDQLLHRRKLFLILLV